MRSESIREAIGAEPFHPFTLRMADGREYHVPHPEFAFLTPEGRTAMVVGKDDVVTLLDVMLITALHFDRKRNGKGPAGKRKSA